MLLSPNRRIATHLAAPDRPAGPGGSSPLPTVVVIDDDVAVDESFGHMLRAAGYEPHTEADCRSGLAYLETARPSALILDLHLPDDSGLACLRRLRAQPAHRTLPVAILTGDYFLDEEVARELSALGARVFFKPVWEQDLIRIVEQLCGSRPTVKAGGPPAGGCS
jgi:two-component system, chemotaxis family, chemotaxis protein CheY